jgi:C-terminal processing protease CtpA/Prc
VDESFSHFWKGEGQIYPVRSGMACLVLLALGLIVGAQPAVEKITQRGFLGVMVSSASEGQTGVMVSDVTPGSPAAQFGLKKGDRIFKFANEEARDVERFLPLVAAKKPGEKIALDIVRDGKDEKLTVTLGEWPAREATSPNLPSAHRPAFLRVQAQAVTPKLKKRLNSEVDAGAVVTEVVPNSPAAKAGLQRDDVITALDDQPVRTPSELRDAVQKAGPGKEVAIQVVRGKERRSLKATLREGAIGYFLTPGEERFPTVDVESMLDQSRRIGELERRVEELEKRLGELEKKKQSSGVLDRLPRDNSVAWLLLASKRDNADF